MCVHLKAAEEEAAERAARFGIISVRHGCVF
jgi:hypothetical protein